jgi:hypothetical protein
MPRCNAEILNDLFRLMGKLPQSVRGNSRKNMMNRCDRVGSSTF